MGLHAASLYAKTARRVLTRGGLRLDRLGSEERLVFVVGSPRSGTTFLGDAIGGLDGFVDLGEVAPHKAAIPDLYRMPEEEAAKRIRLVLDRARRLGLVPGLRAVEQTPETAFVLPAALRAFPRAQAVHIVRDGRDVVCSLLERGWLGAERAGRDDAGFGYGREARFWVEPERADEFERASDATRAAWAWRRYVSAARAASERTHEIRYEALTQDRQALAGAVSAALGVAPAAILTNLRAAHAESVGRYRRDLTQKQLADVEREAGKLLRELGYK